MVGVPADGERFAYSSCGTWGLVGVELDAPVPTGGPLVDPDDPAFLPPGDLPARVQAACRRTGQPAPATRPELVRCILDSLAAAFARAVADARLSGRQVEVVHLVGGDLEALRALVRQTQEVRRHRPAR